MKHNNLLLTVLFITALYISVAAQLPGSLDLTFNPGTGVNSEVKSTVIQSDGKIIIGGSFILYDGATRHRIARVNTDGSLDDTFDPGTGANNEIYKATLQSDGKVIIMGPFTSYDGIARNRIARLNTNGSLDETFSVGTGLDYGGSAYATAIQSNGKIIIGGDFSYFNGTARKRIARLEANGTIDLSFNPGTGANNVVHTIAIQNDGKIIIGGRFTSYNGIARNYIARLNIDGTLDNDFNPGTGASGFVHAIQIQTDGKIIIAGSFNSYNGTSRNRIARLNEDGSLDETFNPGAGANDVINTIALQSDGRIIIGGVFTTFNGVSGNRIARLKTDGSLDEAFNPGTGANDIVFANSIQSDGKIIIGGYFTSYNGTDRKGIARILSNSTTAVNSPETPAITIYPNPFSSELTIEILGNRTSRFEIFSSIGQLLAKGHFTEKTTIHTGSFLPGVYLIKLENGNAFEYYKILKQ